MHRFVHHFQRFFVSNLINKNKPYSRWRIGLVNLLLKKHYGLVYTTYELAENVGHQWLDGVGCTLHFFVADFYNFSFNA